MGLDRAHTYLLYLHAYLHTYGTSHGAIQKGKNNTKSAISPAPVQDPATGRTHVQVTRAFINSIAVVYHVRQLLVAIERGRVIGKQRNGQLRSSHIGD